MTKEKMNGKCGEKGGENCRKNAGFCVKDRRVNMYKKRTKRKQKENDF